MKSFAFNGQRPGEGVEEVVKNHWFVLFLPVVKSVVFLIIPIIFFIYFGANLYFSIITIACVLIAFSIISDACYIYFASVFLITSERVIYLHQKSILNRQIIETNLDRIQDIASNTDGLAKNIFSFGDLTIRTAGASTGSEIVVKNIPNPYALQQIITKKIK